jgi:hypothetical protein
MIRNAVPDLPSGAMSVATSDLEGASYQICFLSSPGAFI